MLPPHPEYGSYTSSVKGSPGNTFYSFELNVACDREFKLTGSASISCAQGLWSEKMPECREFCLQPSFFKVPISYCVFASGEVYMDGTNNGTAPDETDDSKTETNKTMSCVIPEKPRYGSWDYKGPGVSGDSVESFELTLSCYPGYELVGPSNINCSSGRLSHPIPRCLAPCSRNENNTVETINCSIRPPKKVSTTSTTTTTTESPADISSLGLCKLPPFPEHGMYSSYPEGQPGTTLASFQLNVTCDRGYNLVGDTKIICIYGLMEKEMPVCLPYCIVGQKSKVTCANEAPQCLLASENEVLRSSRVGSEPDCGIIKMHSRRKREPISGGFEAKPHELPWHTGIYRKNPEPVEQICGGSLISKRVVLSAAHCFTTSRTVPSASNYALAAGKIIRSWYNKAEGSAQTSDVQEIKIPPRYQGAVANFQDDLAIVISVDEFDFEFFVKPACLSFDPKFDEEQLQDGKLGKIGGWGLTDEESTPSRKLRTARLPYINIDKCIEDSPVSFKSSITGDKICAGYDNGTSACRGDSGGGIVFPAYEDYVRRYYLRGLISTSPVNNKDCNIYTWVTFTHLQKHADFIMSATRGLL
ncbi:modular serine protease-like isoform X2 [Manduca sexta]|nr:modular serine protease-like isoform X2 [Manduca sexta]